MEEHESTEERRARGAASRCDERGQQGEAEGFEHAEAELIEHASHGDPGPDPSNLAGEPRIRRGRVEYGEADHEHSSEDDRPD